MSGITSPARPWFKLTTPDPDLSEIGPVKQWLHIVSQRMSNIFLKSNIYNSLPIVYGDLGVFGTSAMLIEEDFEDVIYTQSLPIGSYWIAKDNKGKVNTFMREFQMTVRQVVSKFGMNQMTGKIDWSKFSDFIKSEWDKGNYETWIYVRHIIKPNDEYDNKKLGAKFKKYVSCYYESGGGNTNAYNQNYLYDDRFLSESGYDYFPILCPRWEVTGEDVYGTDCPGMTALGDIKQLQTGEKRSAQAIDKMVNPPMTGPTSLRSAKASILPGDITYVDVREGQQGFRPAHEVNARISELEGKQQQVRERIQRSFYEDLFLMLSNLDRRQITAREIEERHEEKLLALGPVLEQMNQDLLDPIIDITFDIMNRQGMIPQPPEELQGIPLKVEYISVMAQAQKLVGISGIERFSSYVAQVAAINPEALDKFNIDQAIDEYGMITSIPPSLIRTDEEVAAMRQQRAQAAQQQQQVEQFNQISQGARNLSQTDTEKENGLTQMLRSVGR